MKRMTRAAIGLGVWFLLIGQAPCGRVVAQPDFDESEDDEPIEAFDAGGVDEADFKAADDAFRRRVRAELIFIRDVCRPNKEQFAGLKEQIERLSAAAPPDAVVGSLAGSGAFYYYLGRDLERVVQRELGGERQSLYSDERRRADERLRQARILERLVALDRELLLSVDQREKLGRMFDARWPRSDSLRRIDQGPDGRLLRVKRKLDRSSSALPELPEVFFEIVLRPNQCAARRASRRLALNAVEGFGAVDAQEDEPLDEEEDDVARDMEDDPLDQDEDAGAPDLEDENETDATSDAQRGDPAVRAALEAFLGLWLDDLDATVGLSAAQRRKLELAGKSDIQGCQRRLADMRKKIHASLRFAQTPLEALTNPSSALRKVLAHVLSAQQAEMAAEVERRRQAVADNAARQAVVAFIAERVPMTGAQWEQLSKLLAQRCEALGGRPFDTRELADVVPGELLKSLYDEAHWELVGPVFDELLTQ